jgi:hypothetical protein
VKQNVLAGSLYKAVRDQRMSGCVALGRLLVGIDVTQR